MHAVLNLFLMVIRIYIWLLIAQAILSWLLAFSVVNRHNHAVAVIGDFLYRITEPALRPILSASSSTTSSDLPIAPAAGGVHIAVRLTPRARADRLDGVAQLADGAVVLKVSVTAPPSEDRANDALLQLLAKEWGLPRRDLALVGGRKSRNKIVRVAGEPAALMRRLALAISGPERP